MEHVCVRPGSQACPSRVPVDRTLSRGPSNRFRDLGRPFLGQLASLPSSCNSPSYEGSNKGTEERTHSSYPKLFLP